MYFDPTYNPLYVPYLNHGIHVDGLNGFQSSSGYTINPYQMSGFGRTFAQHSSYNDDFNVGEASSSFQGAFRPIGNIATCKSSRLAGPTQNSNAGSHNPIQSANTVASPDSNHGLVSFFLEDFLPWLPTPKNSLHKTDFADEC